MSRRSKNPRDPHKTATEDRKAHCAVERRRRERLRLLLTKLSSLVPRETKKDVTQAGLIESAVDYVDSLNRRYNELRCRLDASAGHVATLQERLREKRRLLGDETAVELLDVGAAKHRAVDIVSSVVASSTSRPRRPSTFTAVVPPRLLLHQPRLHPTLPVAAVPPQDGSPVGLGRANFDSLLLSQRLRLRVKENQPEQLPLAAPPCVPPPPMSLPPSLTGTSASAPVAAEQVASTADTISPSVDAVTAVGAGVPPFGLLSSELPVLPAPTPLSRQVLEQLSHSHADGDTVSAQSRADVAQLTETLRQYRAVNEQCGLIPRLLP